MNYRVTFRRCDTDTFSTNICVAKNEDEVREYYSKYCDLSVRPASNSEYDEAKRKGMPIVIIQKKLILLTEIFLYNKIAEQI